MLRSGSMSATTARILAIIREAQELRGSTDTAALEDFQRRKQALLSELEPELEPQP